MKQSKQYYLLIIPVLIICVAFFLLPMVKLLWLSLSEQNGISYWYILTKPMYLKSLLSTFLLSFVVTVASLVIATIVGLFLTRYEFKGKSLLVAMLSFPLVFPGVVIGFFVIMLAGRQGLFAELGRRSCWRALDPGLFHFWPLYWLFIFLYSSRGADEAFFEA